VAIRRKEGNRPPPAFVLAGVHVAALWRYPVKSLAGEHVGRARVGNDGIAGDRVVHVAVDGRIVTARARPQLLGLRGRLGEDGEPTIGGVRWDDPAALAAVREVVRAEAVERLHGAPVRLIRSDEVERRFDVLPFHVATDGTANWLGIDVRRLRPNLVVAGVDGLAERDWPGRVLRAGEVEIEVVSLRGRCVMTTVEPDTLERDPAVLRRIVRELGGTAGLDCRILVPGVVAVGDAVTIA
jgi:hypothetical protein